MGVAALLAGWEEYYGGFPSLPGAAIPTPAVPVFPDGAQANRTEILLNGSWNNITSYVQRRDRGVDVTRGRQDEAAQVGYSSWRGAINNRDGRFSPKNPNGPWFGIIGRNTQLRHSIGTGRTRLVLEGVGDDYAACPDTSALSVTGDIDIRLEAYADSWRRTDSGTRNLMGKYRTVGDQRSWLLSIMSSGIPRFAWSTDGTVGTVTSVNPTGVTTVPYVPAHGRIVFRVTLDVDNGAGGSTATFYYGYAMTGPWTQLGTPIVTAGVTSIFNSTADVQIGDVTENTSFETSPRCEVLRAEIRNGIAGTVVGEPDFTAHADATTVFEDPRGNFWTTFNNAKITNYRYEFWGEISSLPQKWDPTGADVWVDLEAAGILRRFAQGASPVRSAMYRAMLSLGTNTGFIGGSTALPVAYWPCEDIDGSTTLASGLGGSAMTIGGTPDTASHTGFKCSAALPQLVNSRWTGTVPTYTSTGQTQVRLLLAVPSGGTTTGAVIARIFSSGTARRWDLVYSTTGDLQLLAYDSDGVAVLTSAVLDANVDGKLVQISVGLTESGADVNWEFSAYQIVTGDNSQQTGTLAGRTVGTVSKLEISPTGNMNDVAVGHIYVQADVTPLGELDSALMAHDGEKAGTRIERLCREDGLNFRSFGDMTDTAAMGAQLADTTINLLREAEAADQGILFEPRDILGFAYRPLSSLYNQQPALRLDYDQAHLSGLEPVDDDQLVRNDITATRKNGSSFRAVQETGPLNVQDPPNGVGRYDEQVTVNVQADTQLPDQAGWRRHLGTVDEARFRDVGLDLTRTEWTTAGNVLGPGTFEDDLEGWAAAGSVPPTVTRDNTRAYQGGWSQKIAWGTGGTLPLSGRTAVGLIVGTPIPAPVSVRVYVPAGSPALLLAIAGGVLGNPSTTNDQWEEITLTFTPTATSHEVQIWPNTSPVSGDLAWVDNVRLPKDLRGEAVDVNIGDRVVAVNPPAWLPPEQISQIAQGSREFLSNREHTLGFNCSPESVYQVGVYDDAGSKYSSDGSTLATAAQQASTYTTLSVATSSGPLWTTDAAQFPFDLMINGERMILKSVSGASSPQTFEVVRSVNGVLKHHTAGTTVALFRPAVYAR